MKVFQLEKPDTSKIKKERILQALAEKINSIPFLIQKTSQPVYVYWDKLKYKKLLEDFSSEELWMCTKFIRRVQSSKSVIKSESGDFFTWFPLPGLEEFFHQIDLNTGGNLFAFAKDDEYSSPKIHMNIYQISKKTSINDLKNLEALGFIASKKAGRNIYYYATDKIDELFN
ncbi:MAG: helix-turn-helix domain-containing protein [Candidatus Omnitrophota bacterium]